MFVDRDYDQARQISAYSIDTLQIHICSPQLVFDCLVCSEGSRTSHARRQVVLFQDDKRTLFVAYVQLLKGGVSARKRTDSASACLVR